MPRLQPLVGASGTSLSESGLENDPGGDTVSAVADLAGRDRAEFEAVVSAAIDEYRDKESGSDEQLREFVAHVYATAVGGALNADSPYTAMEIYENAVERRTDLESSEVYITAFHIRGLGTLGGQTPEDRHERHDRLLERAVDETDLTYGTLAPAYLDYLTDSDDHDAAWL
jgi:cation transport regulator ChaB